MKNIELRHLRYFLEVAKEQNFRKAAENLFISQPGLSRQIANLEKELGYSLFDRNSRNVALTPQGSYLYEEIPLLLKKLSATFEHSQLIGKGLQGSIRMSYVGSAMQNVIPDLLLDLQKELPKMRFSLKERDNSAQIRLIKAGEMDLGFVRLPQVAPPLAIKPLLHDTFSLVLPESHPITQENFSSVGQFSQESFILFEEKYSETYYQTVMSIFSDAGFVPQVSHQTVHAPSIFQLVEKGFGVSIVPSSLQNGYNFRLRFIELSAISQRAVLSALWNTENRNPALKRVLARI